MSEKQKTIQKEITLEGIGLHTGNAVTVTLKPADADFGIRFVRVDLPGNPIIKAEFDSVLVDERLPRCTSIGTVDTAIHTVEHLMSVLCGIGIDNLTVEINGNEMPGLDGSGIEFLRAIKESGIVEQDSPKEYLQLTDPIWIEQNGASICALPSENFKVSYTLNYDHPMLNSQFCSFDIKSDNFENEIAPSRTFCLENEAKELQRNGLGKGANYDNTLVVGNDGVINNSVRFENEFARHKIMDCVGDLYLLGMPLRAHVVAIKSGHTLNLELLKKLNMQKKKQKFVGVISQNNFDGRSELDINDIRKILPHRFPFLLVDRVLELDPGSRVVAVKNVTANEPFFEGHFPTKPIMPGVLMVEAMAQAGGIAVLTHERNKGKIALFMGADKVKFRKVVSPGDQLLLEVEVVRDKTRAAQIRGRTLVNGVVVAEADLLFSYSDAEYLR